MALAVSNLTEGSGGYNTGGNTAAVSWNAGDLIHIAIGCISNVVCTVTQANLTFSQLGSRRWNSLWAISVQEWYAVAGSTQSSKTINLSFAANQNYIWSVNKVTGFNTGGPFINVGTSNGSATVNLAGALGSTSNIMLASHAIISSGAMNADAAFTLLGTAQYNSTSGIGLTCEYAINKTACTVTSGTGSHMIAQASEIVEAASGTPRVLTADGAVVVEGKGFPFVRAPGSIIL